MRKKAISSNKMKKLFTKLFVSAGILFFLALPWVSRALTDEERCENFRKQFEVVSGSANSNIVGDLPRFCSASEIILFVINVGLGFAATIAVVFIVVGGYLYLTASGNDETAEKGRKVITNAVIGLVVIIMSFVIVRVVSNVLTNPFSGGTTGGTTGGTGGPGGTGGGGSGANVLPDLAAAIEFPAQVQANQALTVSFIMNFITGNSTAAENKIVTFCGGGTGLNANMTMKVKIDGTEIGPQGVFTKNNSSITAGVNGKAPASTGQKIITAEICGQQVKSGQINILTATAGGSGNPGGNNNSPYSSYEDCMSQIFDYVECGNLFPEPNTSQPDKQSKANAIPFTLSLSSDKKIVNIDIGGNTSDKMYICGVGSPTSLSSSRMDINVTYQGKTEGYSTVADEDKAKTPPFAQAVSSPVQVEVKICGFVIGGGTKSVGP
jgi:hypothetical protein